MKRGFKIGRILGIPLHVHYSWVFIFALVVFSITSLYPAQYALWTRILAAVAGSLLFFLSLLLHELSHSLVAQQQGIAVKSITLFIFGGAARIDREASRPSEEALMAAAGPASSLAIALFFYLLFWAGGGQPDLIAFAVSDQPAGLISTTLFWLTVVNVSLCIFNLVPGLPLDGGRILRAIVWKATGNYTAATRVASIAGQVFAVLIMAAGALSVIMSRDYAGGLWLIVIGWFVFVAAGTGYRIILRRSQLAGKTARDVMSKDIVQVPAQLSVAHLFNTYANPNQPAICIVNDASGTCGVTTTAMLRMVPHRKWFTTQVRQVMIPSAEIRAVSPDEPATNIFEHLEASGHSAVIVADRGSLIGVITNESIADTARTATRAR